MNVTLIYEEAGTAFAQWLRAQPEARTDWTIREPGCQPAEYRVLAACRLVLHDGWPGSLANRLGQIWAPIYRNGPPVGTRPTSSPASWMASGVRRCLTFRRAFKPIDFRTVPAMLRSVPTEACGRIGNPTGPK